VQRIWLRGVAGIAAALAVGLVALTASGTLDATPDPATGLIAGASALAITIAIAILAGFLGYAALELLQTGRLDSIASQFGTRTLALMPIAIALNVVLGQTIGTALRMPIYLDSIGTILVGVLCGPLAGAATGILANVVWTFGLAGTPLGSPYAWPFAIVAAEIGLFAGLFGRAGFFRSRPDTPPDRLAAGAAVAVVVLAALAYLGILPAYLKGTLIDADLTTVEPFFIAVALGVAAGVAAAAVVLVVRLVRERDLGVAYVVVGGAACGVVSALIATPVAAIFFGGVTGGGTDLLVAAFQQAGSSLFEAVLQQSVISDPIDKTITFVVVFTILRSLPRRFVVRFPQGERALGEREG